MNLERNATRLHEPCEKIQYNLTDSIYKRKFQMEKNPAKMQSKAEAVTQKVFLEKGVLKICSKFTEEHPCQSAISIKLQSMGVLL